MDYIEREKAKKAVKYVPWCDWKAVGNCLDDIPAADVVEVVRCKDCCYRKTDDFAGIYECDNPLGFHGYEVKLTDFCSYGEKRE